LEVFVMIGSTVMTNNVLIMFVLTLTLTFDLCQWYHWTSWGSYSTIITCNMVAISQYMSKSCSVKGLRTAARTHTHTHTHKGRYKWQMVVLHVHLLARANWNHLAI
jgi:hypothetical protein